MLALHFVTRKIAVLASICGIALALPSSEVSAQGPRYKVGPEHEVGEQHDFTRVPHAVFGPDNRLAVSQPQDFSVLLFDLSKPGKPIAAFGRRGQGPGEFSEPGRMGWIDRTLWVADRGRPRVELFDLNGKSLASNLFDPPASSKLFRYVAPTAVLADSVFAYYPTIIGFAIGPSKTAEDPVFPVLLQRKKITKVDTIALPRLLGQRLVIRGDLRDGEVTAITSQPFSDRTFFRSGANGRAMLLVLQSGPEVPAGRALVRVISQNGKDTFRRVLDLRPRAISNQEWDSVVTTLATQYKDAWSTPAKARTGLHEALLRPKFRPAVSAAILGQDGTVWLRLEQERSGKAQWVLLSSLGRDLGTVELPSSIRLMDATASRVVGVRTDSDGVDHVMWMNVDRPTSK